MCLGFEYFKNTSLSEWGNVAKEIFKEDGGGVHVESSVKFTEDSAVGDIPSKRNQ